MKLWDKGIETSKEMEKFTVGNDYLIDNKLVKYDCLASIAHAMMLQKAGVLNKEELQKLVEGLKEIILLDSKSAFEIKQEDEDCHTAIENYLVKKYGDIGKKIHTARSRNDQVLTAMRLYEKEELKQIKGMIIELGKALQTAIKKYGYVPIPGYTHMQKAMPTTVAVWLGSFYDALQDDIKQIDAAYLLVDQNPLGSAAGFGVPVFKIDKKMTAKLMGFSKVQENPIYCQLSRGKFEACVINALGQIMHDLNKLAADLILFSMQEFGYVTLPAEFCTGSSIMPQKKNPDVIELVRAKYHVVLGEEFKVKSLIGNLNSGYNRDMQLTKEPLFNSVDITKSSIAIMAKIISKMQINEEKCKKAMTNELYATEEAYKLVQKGMPFREAYKEVGKRFI